jgi:hypothetical protein
LGTSKKFGVHFSTGYCRETAAAHSKWLYLGLQHSWRISARPSIHASSGWSLCGSARTTFWASTVTLTSSVASCWWNYIVSQLSHYFLNRTLLVLIMFVWQMFNSRCTALRY